MKTKSMLKLFAGLLLLSTISPQLSSALAQGTAFTYQGRLFDNGLPATNIYDLSIALCSTANAPGGQIGSPVVLADVPVTNGLFTVTLNNASEFGANVFDGTARWLEISVRPGLSTGAYTALSPRQSLQPTPYAIYSGNAATLGGQSATAYVAKAGDTMTGTLNLPPNGLMVGDSADLLYDLVVLNHNVGIGTAGPGALLDVAGNGVLGSTYQQLIQGVGSTLALGANSTAAEVQSKGSGVPLFLNHDGNNVVLVDAGAGNVGIGTASPHVPLEIDSPLSDVSGQEFLRFAFGPSDYNSISSFFNGNPGSSSMAFNVEYASGDIRPVMTLGGSGNVGIGTTAPGGKLHVFGNSAPGSNIPADTTVLATGDGFNNRLMSANGNQAVYLSMYNDVQGEYGELSTFDFGTGQGLELKLNANGGTVSVPVLEIRGGSDLAEPFQMSNEEISKGSLVIIDDVNPGHLKMSNHAYDTRVAGIVSGANGINPGISLHQDGAFAGGENVALSGRVYALADASFGAIKPGDMLTTSSTPGHCMKVTNHAKAQGAIIGKAMSSLENGKGMVLVLVSLQ